MRATSSDLLIVFLFTSVFGEIDAAVEMHPLGAHRLACRATLSALRKKVRLREIQSGRWCACKDVTGSKDPAEVTVVQLIGQIEDKRQAVKRPESEAPGPSEF